DPHHPLEVSEAGVPDRPERAHGDTGVVAEYVDPAVLLVGAVRQRDDRLVVADVGLNRDRCSAAVADFFRDLRSIFLFNIGHHDSGTATRSGNRDGPPYSTASTRDDYDGLIPFERAHKPSSGCGFHIPAHRAPSGG